MPSKRKTCRPSNTYIDFVSGPRLILKCIAYLPEPAPVISATPCRRGVILVLGEIQGVTEMEGSLAESEYQRQLQASL